MKTLKITFLLALIFMIFDANAQMTKNSFLLGANLNFDLNSITQKDAAGTKIKIPSTYSLTLNPKVGYFAAKDLAVGVDLNLMYGQDTTVITHDAITKTRLLIGPFARYYFTLRESVYLFFEGSFGIGISSSDKISKNVLGGGIGPGLSFLLTDNVALEALGKFNYLNSSGSELKESVSNINLSVGLVYYYRARPTGVR